MTHPPTEYVGANTTYRSLTIASACRDCIVATIVMALLFALPPSLVSAGLRRRIPYVARLTEPVTHVTAIRVALYRDALGGKMIWGEERHLLEDVSLLQDGETSVLTLLIGASALDVRDDAGEAGSDGLTDLDQIDLGAAALFLEVSLEKEDGQMITLAPRQPLFPYFHADTASLASSVMPGGIGSASIKTGAVTSSAIERDAVRAQHIGLFAIDDEHIDTEGISRVADQSVLNRHIDPVPGISKFKEQSLTVTNLKPEDLGVAVSLECHQEKTEYVDLGPGFKKFVMSSPVCSDGEVVSGGCAYIKNSYGNGVYYSGMHASPGSFHCYGFALGGGQVRAHVNCCRFTMRDK